MSERSAPLSTPVALLLFNRPDLTARLLARLGEVRPRRLLVVADGPRPHVAGEAESCAAVRQLVERVGWAADVSTNYADENLGCRKRVSSGLDWVFANCERAIILEDDCLPSLDFFPFCDELLDRYASDDRVMQICGYNRIGESHVEASYFFSRFGPIWGWASWRRAWQSYDVDMTEWPVLKQTELLASSCRSSWEKEWRTGIFDRVYSGEINTWDYQWAFAKLRNAGVSIIPAVNLVENTGFRRDATHMASAPRWAKRPVRRMHFPLRHPAEVAPDEYQDKRYVKSLYPTLVSRARSMVKSVVTRPFR